MAVPAFHIDPRTNPKTVFVKIVNHKVNLNFVNLKKIFRIAQKNFKSK